MMMGKISETEILRAINYALSEFLRDADPSAVFGALLTRLLAVTGSEYGFIGEVLQRSDGAPYLKTFAMTNIAWDDATRALYEANAADGLEFGNLETLFGQCLRTGEPVIANHPASDPRSGGLPPGHPRLDAFMAIPFRSDGRLLGMAGLANRKGGYGPDLLESLDPLARTCGLLIAARRESRRREDSEARMLHAVDELVGNEARLRAILDTAVDGIITITGDGMVTSFNPAAQRIFGYSADEVVGRNVSMLMPSPYHEAHDDYLAAYRRTGTATIIGTGREVMGRRKDGSVFPLDLAVSETFPGQRNEFTGIVRDVTAKKRAEEGLKLAESVFRATLEGILITDASGTILAVNPAFTDITGYSAEEAVGANPRILRSDRHKEDFYRTLWASLAETGQWQGEIWNRRKNGEVYLEWTTINAIRDSDGKPVQYVAVFSDITEVRRKDEDIRRLAFHDPLTGLPNRALLQDRLDHAIAMARREGRPLAVLFLDLDRFKAVNDTLGHDAGDDLLKQVGERLGAIVRETDTVARLGGDEFVLVLEPPADVGVAATLAERVIEAINKPVSLRGVQAHVGTSVGIALFPEDGDDAQTLSKHADTAMYAAKAAGKNTFRFFSRAMSEETLNRMSLERDLRRALANDQFELFIQPKMCVAKGNVCGAEALLRWNHPVHGQVPPDRFIPMAEDTGLIIPIGDWVLGEACRLVARMAAEGLADFTLAVNVSAVQFKTGRLPQALAAHMEAHGIPPSSIQVELTESTVMGDPEGAITVLEQFRAAGVSVAIDDFGTGYSSLSYLRKLPIDTLKIDRAFVMDAHQNENDAEIVRTIVGLGKSLHLTVVAEGVELDQHVSMLEACGCAMAQGYYYARPMPFDAFVAWVRERRV